jgi:hypothetical protein
MLLKEIVSSVLGVILGASLFVGVATSEPVKKAPGFVQDAIITWCWQKSADFPTCEIGPLLASTPETPELYGQYAVSIRTQYGPAILLVFTEGEVVHDIK